jgi:hypothetical protein
MLTKTTREKAIEKLMYYYHYLPPTPSKDGGIIRVLDVPVDCNDEIREFFKTAPYIYDYNSGHINDIVRDYYEGMTDQQLMALCLGKK